MIDVSVIIPYYKGAAAILECLQALDAQDNAPAFEVVVVDDSGKEEVSKIRFSPRNYSLRMIYQKHKGQSAATNTGIKEARGALVLLFAQDMIASPNLLIEHRATHGRLNSPDRAVVGYMPFHPDIPHTDFHDFLLSGAQFDFVSIQDKTYVDPSKYFYAPNISLRKSFLLKNGLFDEDLVYGYQDIELGRRLMAKGLRLYFNKRALAYHYHEITLDSFCKKQKLMGKQLRVLQGKYPELENEERLEFLREMFHGRDVSVIARRFVASEDAEQKNKCLQLAARAMAKLKSGPAQKIASILMRSVDKPGLSAHLSPIFYRLILFYYSSQGYFGSTRTD
jgi:GT2 family glycosyltransferase